MPYGILFGEKALSRIPDSLPPEVLDEFEAALQSLARDPLNLGQRTTFPYPPRGKMFPFHVDHAGIRHYFVAFFVFTPGERNILIFSVTYDASPWRGD
jgi:hypothetical protein